VRKEPAEISDAEVHMLAGFGQPEDGLVGKIRYSFRVRARLKVLRPQFEQATQEREAAWNRLEQAKAALGRDVARADAAGENLTVLIRKASMADEALQGAQTAEQSLNAAYEQKNAAIDARINALEQEAAPIRQEEALARAAHEEAQTDCRRATARVKRTEIELRNLREKIAVRQKDYADLKRPAEERQRLLAEISKLDLEGQPVVARLAQQNAEATALEGPLQARSKVLGDAMARLAQKNEQIAGCRREKDALTRDHQIALDAAREKTRGESAESTRVWSLVGEQAYLTGLHRAHPSLAPSGNALEECRLAFLTASRLQELHERAIGAFNTEVCTQANRLMLIAGVSLVVVLAILLTVFS
jgi:chromosome segregation ATPase